jgi:hypothetical protein
MPSTTGWWRKKRSRRRNTAMPVYWTIDSRERLVTAVAEGDVIKDEMMAYLDAVAGAKAIGYRRLFDGSRGNTSMPSEDIMALAFEIRRLQTTSSAAPGPLAMIVPSDKFELLARVFGVLAVPERPMQFFPNAEAARSWLDSTQIRGWAPKAP